jgi:hypothetical protein
MGVACEFYVRGRECGRGYEWAEGNKNEKL